MPLSREQAQDVLRDVEQTARRSASAHGYEAASPYLFLWGVIWMVAYGASDLAPREIGEWAWPVLGTIGWVGSMAVGQRHKSANAAGTKTWLRWLLVFVAYAVFAVGVGAIMRPTSDAQIGAFIPMIVALTYALVGIFFNATRLIVAGAAIAALTLGGYFYLPSHFGLWMALVGGGALILAGLWMRQV
jgi:pheromone shutdown protein TraB